MTVAIDAVRLVEGCRAGLAAQPPALPGWELTAVRCEASLSDPGLRAARPEMADRPAIVARWRLEAPHAAAPWRRLAEEHLSGRWHAAGVNAADAWAAQPLPPVLVPVPEDLAMRGFVAFREAVDTVFGPRAAALEYAAAAGGGRAVSLRTALPMARIAALAGRIGDMEVTSLSRSGDGGWVLEGRQTTPVRLVESRFEALTGETVDAG